MGQSKPLRLCCANRNQKGVGLPNRSQVYSDGYKLSAFFPSSAKSFHLVVVWKMSKTQQVDKQLYKPLISKGESLRLCSLCSACFRRGKDWSSLRTRFLAVPLTTACFSLGRSDKPCAWQPLLQVQADKNTRHQCLCGHRQWDLWFTCFLRLQHGGQAVSELPQVSWRYGTSGHL